MSLPPIDPHNIEALLTRILELSVPLHDAIADFDEPGANYEMVGPPGVAVFRRDLNDVIGHVSGSPSPLIMPVIDELRTQHIRARGLPAGTDNSHLPPLLLLCCYLADPSFIRDTDLEQIIQRPATVLAIDEETGKHDPELEPLDAALRAWTPLAAQHAPDAGIHPAIIEMRFPSGGYQRHVPWEGKLGETAHVPRGRS
jgi:hypothetical protein